MAQKVQITLTDDLLDDDTPADETLTFAVDGVTYEIDLSSENAGKLRDAVAPYIAAGRRAGSAAKKQAAATTRRPRAASGGRSSANEVRAWAREQGMEVSERGRVRDEVKAAYEAAHR